MPYVLKHQTTGTLLAGFQTNGYKLDYYGIFLWEEAPEEQQISETLATAGIARSDPAAAPEQWQTVELTEHEAKMANVKLRNDPRRVVYQRDGVLHASAAPE